jgi:hypothetical protein
MMGVSAKALAGVETIGDALRVPRRAGPAVRRGP